MIRLARLALLTVFFILLVGIVIGLATGTFSVWEKIGLVGAGFALMLAAMFVRRFGTANEVRPQEAGGVGPIS